MDIACDGMSLATWSYSHARFAMALPTERTEAVLEGLTRALAFFGCVPKQLWWDNPKTIATQILRGRTRRLNERYAAFASHYAIDPCACMPASGWEKPDVEHSVYDLQRRWATPVPRVQNNDELNAYLLRCCLAEMDRTVTGQTQTIGQRFAQDKAAAGELPSPPFDPCVYQTVKVSLLIILITAPPLIDTLRVAILLMILVRKNCLTKGVLDNNGHRPPRTRLSTSRMDPGPDPLLGDAGSTPRGVGPRPGVSRLEAPGGLWPVTTTT